MGNDYSLNYRIEGEGVPLLLIHGLGVTFSIWENLLPLLRPHYKLILIELPGQGSSPALPEDSSYYAASADEIEALRRRLRIEQWGILCYSLGAWIGQAYLACYPERVRQVIFVCPARLTVAAWLSLRSLLWIDRRIPALTNRLLRGRPLHNLVRLLAFSGHDHPYARGWTSEISAQPVAVIKRMLAEMPNQGRAPFTLPDRPALLLWSDQDVIAERPRKLRPADQMIHGDHSAPMLAAESIAREVLCFIESAG